MNAAGHKKIPTFFLSVVVILGATFALTACQPKDVPGKCQTENPHPYSAPYDMQSCPGDIDAWLQRANMCAHFMGEEPYDDDRRAELLRYWNEHQCEAIQCDYRSLFLKYEGDIVYAGILSGYAEQAFGAVDDMPACAQAE